ncbi:hypothetical protein [Pedobacter frigiditerrae]|uniref:lipopolysaccharide biosynthesis protein n=1 Tax=Pedobacter frigiditerrae TaxID=2530452 RepID=UPI00292E76F3|nr:hypothetical protein [Pedobacter frigiditerrae]
MLITLGIEDFGVYSIVGGVVAMLGFFTSAMSTATQRFFSFALGQSDAEKLKRIFTVNLVIYGTIAVLALILLETLGLWFVTEKLKVPVGRFDSVIFIYHFSVLTFIATIFTTPFMSIIIAHEDMKVFAYISIIEALMKLGMLFLLVKLPWDKLELYGVLICGVAGIVAIIYVVFCIIQYKECQFKEFNFDRKLANEIVGFTGWSLLGQVSTVMRNQAVTILLNQTFNPMVVAARAITMNVTSQINVFSNNFNVGLSPPIIKLYASGDKKGMFLLLFRGSKATFFLMWVFALPLFLEMDPILHLWLKTLPQEAILFTRLALVEVLIISISLPIMTAARAPGRMKVYELSLGLIQVAIFFVSWLVLVIGGAAFSVFIVAIVANLIMFIVRLVVVRTLLDFPLYPFFLKVILPICLVILISSIPAIAVHLILPKGKFFIGVSVLASLIFASLSMYFFGIDKLERQKAKILILSQINRMF